jgi:hypothetical protein
MDIQEKIKTNKTIKKNIRQDLFSKDLNNKKVWTILTREFHKNINSHSNYE